MIRAGDSVCLTIREGDDVKPGVFCTVFQRDSVEAVVDAIVDAGFVTTQFHASSVGEQLIAGELSDEVCTRVRNAFERRELQMAALSGTFNIIHPDLAVRESDFERFDGLASCCRKLGAETMTLCTGTMNPEWMWRPHPENGSKEAWEAMLGSLGRLAEIAETRDVTLAFEPEVSNVIDSAKKAREAIDTVGSDRIKVCIDGANLFHAGELPRMTEILDEAFDLLGDDIVMAHAKDVSRDGEAGHDAAGTGKLDYDRYIHNLREIGYPGTIALHSLDESQVPFSRDFLFEKLGVNS
tara:strand:+ start:1738 stop:2625 length:888 start_codon:yes stop_codon:yes gene_type:complete